MPTRKEILEIGGREVAVSNPDKVYFPKAGHTKMDLVNYYLAVADGALRGVAGRPMALKRFVDGAECEAFFQKRAPGTRTCQRRRGGRTAATASPSTPPRTPRPALPPRSSPSGPRGTPASRCRSAGRRSPMSSPRTSL